MRTFAHSFLASILVLLCTHPSIAQPQANASTLKLAAAKAAPAPPADADVKDLPVRKVVLYKNGVGYFEHAGSVNGNQRVTIDFTSSQLNDVLQSLTVLDQGGGRIAGVNYNSTTPLAEQLKTLSLGMSDDPTSTELFQALRGQRVEVSGGPGGALTGRLMSIESRTERLATATDGSVAPITIDKFYLTLVASSGAVKVVELTPTLSVRPLDANLQGQLDRYLELLSAARSTGLRHLTLDAQGKGQREVQVSYISEVPVWKSTYRIVFPREGSGSATLQGWAVVDNTVGADWNNVQLSLVAGAPQSFIQPLSQPLYARRPEIPITTAEETTPQTHEAAEEHVQSEMMNGPLAPLPSPQVKAGAPGSMGGPQAFGVAGMAGIGSGNGGGSGGGLIADRFHGAFDHLSSAFKAGEDVSTNAFDDFFEYALTSPVTIHKNESAMVPILQEELPADHVTLWSEASPSALRAVWLENKSKLTLDSGSFSIFENGEFAGEGLLDPIHPGEKRLLSYATDQAVRVKVVDRKDKLTVHHISLQKGILVETNMNVASVAYKASNSADVDRVVLIEHPRRDKTWSLDDGVKADETAPNLYRFKVAVAAHANANLEVREHGPAITEVNLAANPEQREFLLQLVKDAPDAMEKLKPVIDAQAALNELDERIAESNKQEQTAAADEARVRENLTALKGNEAAKRFVDELNRAEDQLQATRKQIADLEAQKKAALEKLQLLISSISLDWDVTPKADSSDVTRP